jgi:hypothetical protein
MLFRFCGLVTFIVLVHTVYAGNCSLSPKWTIERELVKFDVTGLSVKSTPLRNGQPAGQNSFSWGFDKIVERLKTPETADHIVIGNYGCISPRTNFAEISKFLDGAYYIDPLEPSVPGRICTGFRSETQPGSAQCGEVVSYLEPYDLDCYSQRILDEIGGFKRETILVKITHPLYPEFSLDASYAVVDADYNYTYHHPFGGEFNVQYLYVAHFPSLYSQKNKLVLTVATCTIFMPIPGRTTSNSHTI